MGKKTFWLVSDTDGMFLKLREGQNRIGREAGINHLVLGGSGVSRTHAEAMVSGEDLFVRDLGSSNGTFVNGQRVTTSQLQDGDNVTFGADSYRVKLEQVYDTEQTVAQAQWEDPSFDAEAAAQMTPQMVAAALAQAQAEEAARKGVTIKEGKLDSKGLARVEGVKPGEYQVIFLELDKDVWGKLNGTSSDSEPK